MNKIEEALDIIDKARAMTIATIDSDGSPRSTILLAVIDDKEITWQSSPEAIHSKNIELNPRIGISAFFEDKSINEFRAVYISTTAHSVDDAELAEKDAPLEYRAQLGEFNEAYSGPNRLYFKNGTSK